MIVLDKLLKIKQSFADADRETAMNALMKKAYYDFTRDIKIGVEPTLFCNEYVLNKFCEDNQLDIRAVNWLLKAM